VIDLIALAPPYQGRGLARALLAFVETEAPQPVLAVGTQALNLPSVRLYESWGFRLSSVQYVFHYFAENTGSFLEETA
jgi:GNAT superfamily N-acetyltransferase